MDESRDSNLVGDSRDLLREASSKTSFGSVLDSRDKSRSLSREEFTWDNIIKWLVTGILGLTMLNEVAEFVRSYAVVCYVPEENSQVAQYINNFCYGKLPRSEYFSFYIVIHGLAIIAPHILWNNLSHSQFNYFFDLVNSLDRLRESKTGEYGAKNFEIVSRLEDEFVTNRPVPWIFILYLVKTSAQLVFAFASLLFNFAFFRTFPDVFDCPTDTKHFDNASLPHGWYRSKPVTCTFPLMGYVEILRYADVLLTFAILGLLCWSLLWCVVRHSDELGYKDVADFSAKSSFRPEHYKRLAWRKDPFRPGIRSDMDFLILLLFRASSGRGTSFRELQIFWEMKKQYDMDNELLQLLSNHKSDMLYNADKEGESHRQDDVRRLHNQAGIFWPLWKLSGVHAHPRFMIDKKLKPKYGLEESDPPTNKELKALAKALQKEIGESELEQLRMQLYESINLSSSSSEPQPSCSPCSHRQYRILQPLAQESECETLLRKWKEDGGTRGKLQDALNKIESLKAVATRYDNGKFYMSTTTKQKTMSFQNRLYGFIQLIHRLNRKMMAMDISFDTTGCAFLMSWAFESAVTIKFHSHFRDMKLPVRKETFYNNVSIISLPTDIFSLQSRIACQMDEYLEQVFFPQKLNGDERAERRSGKNDKDDCYVNFLVIGPVETESKKVTVNLFLEQLHYPGRDIGKGALMLTVRPLKIAGTDVSKEFKKYTPPIDIFQHYTDSTSPDNSSVIEQPSLLVASASSVQEQIPSASSQVEKEEQHQLIKLEVKEPPPEVEHPGGFVRSYSTTSEEDIPHCITTMADLRKLFKEEAYEKTASGEEGILCYCGKTECLVQFDLYKYREPVTRLV